MFSVTLSVELSASIIVASSEGLSVSSISDAVSMLAAIELDVDALDPHAVKVTAVNVAKTAIDIFVKFFLLIVLSSIFFYNCIC